MDMIRHKNRIFGSGVITLNAVAAFPWEDNFRIKCPLLNNQEFNMKNVQRAVEEKASGLIIYDTRPTQEISEEWMNAYNYLCIF